MKFNAFVLLSAIIPAIWFCPAQAAPTASVEEPPTPVQDKWAVVIGISQFANPSLNLKYAAKDATDFKDFLISKCHFAPDHVKLLTNQQATKDRILDVLGQSWLPHAVLPEDMVVIYISSHGSPSDLDMAGVNYVVAHDTNPDKLFVTGIPIQHLSNTIKERVKSNRVLILLDACHSGGASDSSKGIVRTGNVDAQQIAQGTGHAVICSSQKSEASWESKSYPNGVFTRTLIDAFQSKGPNTKLNEAFTYLKDGVQKQVVKEHGVIQTPVLETSKWKGQDLVLAVLPTNPRSAPVEAPEPQLESKPTPAPTAVESAATPSAIPDISGPFLGSNGLTYTYWQKGYKCGWAMPMFGVTGKCVISDDGKTLTSSWSGPVSGCGTASLECDATGRVVKIVDVENNTTLTRVETAR